MLHREWPNPLDEFIEELCGSHEHGKVPTALDWYELLMGRPDQVKVFPGQCRWRGEVLVALKEEDGKPELSSKLLRPLSAHMWNQLAGAQNLAVKPIVDVSHRIPWSDQRKPDGSGKELLRALEPVGPLALYLVSLPGCVRRRTHVVQFTESLCVVRLTRLVSQRIESDSVASGCIGHLAGAHEGMKEIGPRSCHPNAHDRPE